MTEMTTIGTILVGSDLTEASDAVVAAAAGIAAGQGAALHILHAFDIPSRAAPAQGPEGRASFPERIARAEEALDRQIERVVTPAGAKVGSRRVEIFVAHRAITDAAEGLGADLIVVGAHSHKRMGDELLGSTADRVVRAANVPCLVVRAPLALPLRRVIAPVDRSRAALGALEVALEWTGVLGAEGGASLTVLHVLPRALDIPEFSLDPGTVGSELHAEIAAARTNVLASGVKVDEEVRWADDAVDEIVASVRRLAADLIVLGTHGHGLLRRFLIGSVASGVVRRAPCAVLLVPPSVWEEESRELAPSAA